MMPIYESGRLIADSRGVLRSGMEYPVVDVTFAYLAAINKLKTWGGDVKDWSGVRTVDDFTDKAVEGYCYEFAGLFARQGANNNDAYFLGYNSTFTTADFRLLKVVAGSSTCVASEAVDLPANRSYHIWFQAVGSAISGSRDGGTTFSISATDTDLPSGGYGAGGTWNGPFRFFGLAYYLRAPKSSLQSAKAIMEAEIIGSGKEDDPYRPNLAQLLDTHPDYGNIDKYAVTWGAFEFHPDQASAVIIVVTGDNPYQSGAIDTQKQNALRSFDPPASYDDAITLYQNLKGDHPEWLAGKDNFSYQVLGHEIFELFAVADFYYGEMIEHQTHYDQLKRVTTEELYATIKMWQNRLKQYEGQFTGAVAENYDKHMNKLKEVLKV